MPGDIALHEVQLLASVSIIEDTTLLAWRFCTRHTDDKTWAFVPSLLSRRLGEIKGPDAVSKDAGDGHEIGMMIDERMYV